MVLVGTVKEVEPMILQLLVQLTEEMVAKVPAVMAIITLVVYIIIKEHLEDQEL